MCLILLAVGVTSRYRVVLAGNRDEFHRRRTAALHRWGDLPVIGGRDLQAGGTWLGVSDDGRRMAAVTNVRDGAQAHAGRRSRGDLPVEFVVGTRTARAAAEDVRTSDAYAPVNLLVDDGTEMWWATNHRDPRITRIEKGIHGLSNGALDERWPKVAAGVDRIAALLRSGDGEPHQLLDMLYDTTAAPPELLPDTGIPIAQEKVLSPMFIAGDVYGTRASTVLRLAYDGGGDVTERHWAPDGTAHTVSVCF